MNTGIQNCANCAHSSGWSLTPTGRIRQGHGGKCTAPVVISVLPDSVRIAETRYAIWVTEGAECKVWKAKP